MTACHTLTLSVSQYLSTNVSGAAERGISVSTSRSQHRGPDQPTVTSEISDAFDAHLTHTSYYCRFDISTPNLLAASVFLTFAFLEATPLQVPPHLPATRAVAIATERFGPTMADFAAVTSRRTPLVADSFLQCQSRESNTDLARERQRPSRSGMHDEDFYRIARHLHAPIEAWELLAYIPGLLTGVWEGCYMVREFSDYRVACSATDIPDRLHLCLHAPLRALLALTFAKISYVGNPSSFGSKSMSRSAHGCRCPSKSKRVLMDMSYRIFPPASKNLQWVLVFVFVHKLSCFFSCFLEENQLFLF